MAVPTQLRRNQLSAFGEERQRCGGKLSRGSPSLFFPSRNAIKHTAQTQHTGSTSCQGKSKGLQPWEREVITPQI